jgi:two-component system alkaline phosphatase synthesis response regulator PhoP
MAAKILVVDDETKVLAVIQKRLESVGYEVITAQDGSEGLKKARSENPDLIILDLILPGIDGYQVCSILKHDTVYKKIPILMLTVRSQKQDMDEGMRVGADAYMIKPFKHEVLLDKVDELLKKAEEEKSKEMKEKEAEEKEHGDRLLKEAEAMGVLRKEEKAKKNADKEITS